MVDEERLLDLLVELRTALPKEISEAEALLSQRDELLGEAHRRAEEIMVEARQTASTLLDQSEIVAAAHGEAERVKAESARDIQAQQAGADRYADEVLGELEAKIARALSTIQNGRQHLGAE